MLKLTIPESEYWDPVKEEFLYEPPFNLSLEHSLVSVSKWESKYHTPFIGSQHTQDQILDYVKFMTLTQNVPEKVYNRITESIMQKIMDYITDTMTATTFVESNKKRMGYQVLTSEEIYYCMVRYGIPFECQKWHLNRLLALIRVCNEKNNEDSNKMSKKDIYTQNHELNRQRREKLNSLG